MRATRAIVTEIVIAILAAKFAVTDLTALTTTTMPATISLLTIVKAIPLIVLMFGYLSQVHFGSSLFVAVSLDAKRTKEEDVICLECRLRMKQLEPSLQLMLQTVNHKLM